MHQKVDLSVQELWRRSTAAWGELWGCRGIEDRLTIHVSSRFSSTLGRFEQKKNAIIIADFLLNEPEQLLAEVLCHETAHAAVNELYGHSARPHGEEWSDLMCAAGYTPRIRINSCEFASNLPARIVSKGRWEHRCPVCHMRRIASRPVSRWRCRNCSSSGLEGELTITKVSSDMDLML